MVRSGNRMAPDYQRHPPMRNPRDAAVGCGAYACAMQEAVLSLAHDRRARRNAIRLAAAQALAGANATVVFATASIMGSTLAPDKALRDRAGFGVRGRDGRGDAANGVAGSPLRPPGRVHRRERDGVPGWAGRRGGAADFLLPAVLRGDVLAGLYGAVVQSFRFAAADGASAAFRARALSWVMVGGVFSGVLGPQLVTWTMTCGSPICSRRATWRRPRSRWWRWPCSPASTCRGRSGRRPARAGLSPRSSASRASSWPCYAG